MQHSDTGLDVSVKYAAPPAGREIRTVGTEAGLLQHPVTVVIHLQVNCGSESEQPDKRVLCSRIMQHHCFKWQNQVIFL